MNVQLPAFRELEYFDTHGGPPFAICYPSEGFSFTRPAAARVIGNALTMIMTLTLFVVPKKKRGGVYLP